MPTHKFPAKQTAMANDDDNSNEWQRAEMSSARLEPGSFNYTNGEVCGRGMRRPRQWSSACDKSAQRAEHSKIVVRSLVV